MQNYEKITADCTDYAVFYKKKFFFPWNMHNLRFIPYLCSKDINQKNEDIYQCSDP